MLARMENNYAVERTKPYAGNEFANWVRHDIAIEAKKLLFGWPVELTLKSSVGSGQWAAVPWLAFFDPIETKTATQGLYVVYLINAQTKEVVLSMNQGTTQVYQEFGEMRGRDVLRRRAVDIRERVADFAKDFSTDPIDLSSIDSLPQGYEAGHAFGKIYSLSDLAEKDIWPDLSKMLTAYRALIDRGGITPIDLMHGQSGSQDIEETRKYVLSRKIERAPAVRKEVLSKKKAVCEACGLDPKVDYNFKGPVDKTPLDVHHAKPIHTLMEGETRRYRVPDDFMVLCPTCHRMIHKLDDPSDVDALKRQIRFKHMREMGYPTY